MIWHVTDDGKSHKGKRTACLLCKEKNRLSEKYLKEKAAVELEG